MSWLEIGSVETQGTTIVGFLNAVEIWRKKPHVVNRRLCGAQLLFNDTVSPSVEVKLDDFVIQIQSIYRQLTSNSMDDIVKITRDRLERISQTDKETIGNKWSVTVRRLIPKNEDKMQHVIEVVIIDDIRLVGVFVPVAGVNGKTGDVVKIHDFPHKIVFDQNQNKMFMYLYDVREKNGGELSTCNCSVDWLANVLLVKLARWSEETKLNTDVNSLRLVCVKRYSQMYNELKNKYGQHFVKIWPEQTDPRKFVYEDIGIAAYLLVIWEMERNETGLKALQSFVDIGCGNGLLVYILTSEGHSGLGIDVRRRKIWNLLSDVAILKECAIKPSDESLFPHHDWLIGNHSDELTPWIPVIAARSHYHCRYFVLPCCAWDFATKFNGNNSRSSQYQSYLDFVAEVGQVCGFLVERDMLRIPSTKRVCFVGKKRSYSSTDEEKVDSERKNYIRNRCKSSLSAVPMKTKSSPYDVTKQSLCLTSGIDISDVARETYLPDNEDIHIKTVVNRGESSTVNDLMISCDASHFRESHVDNKSVWLENFQPRSSVEKIRNAVCIEQKVKDHIALTVLNAILKVIDPINLANGKTWNKGGILPLHKVSQLFDSDILSQLKSECGGLQTLLKNCPDVFIVRNGEVGLRDWTSKDYNIYRSSRQKKRPNYTMKADQLKKTKFCFFFLHHPDGCPLDNVINSCRFAHGKEDLRTIGNNDLMDK